MRKLIVACPCGQRMQVARSAYGKTGVCPKCGQKIRVGANGADAPALPSPDAMPGDTHQAGAPLSAHQPPTDRPGLFSRRPMETQQSKQRFGQAVDLFYRSQYAEALAIFESLLKDHPGNLQIEAARLKCQQSLAQSRLALPQKPIDAPPQQPEPSPQPEVAEPAPEHTQHVQSEQETLPARSETEPQPANEHETQEVLSLEAVRRTVMDLMARGKPDSVRLQAAELALRLLDGVQNETSHPATISISELRNGKGMKTPPPAESAALGEVAATS